MSPRKTRQAAIQAAKSLATAKKQPARAKKKPEPKKVVKKKPQKPKNTSKKTVKAEPTRDTESNTNIQTGSENTPENEPKRKYKRPNTYRKKVITQERLLTVINQFSTTVGEPSEKCLQTESEEISLSQALQEQQDEENRETEDTEQRTIYSCKFCNKDFSSAFILFLHIRIHEKVGNITEPAVKDDPDQAVVTEEYIVDNESDDEPEIKEEIIEEITIPDIDDEEEVGPQPKNDPLQITDEPKTKFVGIINKNFVENLKKNLSLAMNRQVN